MCSNPLRSLALLLSLNACAPAPAALPHAALSRLESPVGGERVYVGSVAPQGQDDVAFRYERRVETLDGDFVSVHITRDERSVVLLHRAVHDEGYRLRSFEEINRQTGVCSRVRVDHDQLDFRVSRGGETTHHREHVEDPVVAGPTLFGFVLRNLARLEAGGRLRVRFLTADASYGFELRVQSRSSDSLTIAMEPTDFFVRLGVATIRLDVDLRANRVVRYHGRVPVRLHDNHFDADIDYVYETAFR